MAGRGKSGRGRAGAGIFGLMCGAGLLLLLPLSASALPKHEWGEPSGSHAGEPPRGVVQIVDQSVGTGLGRRVAGRFRALGFKTLDHAFSPGPAGIEDVKAFHELARKEAGDRRPVCLWGASAAGHIATYTATQVPVDCVISEGLATFMVLPPAYKNLKAKELEWVRKHWGKTMRDLRRWSPVTHASDLRGNVLAGASATDRVTPFENARGLRAANESRVSAFELQGGTCPFVHTPVNCVELDAFRALERRLVDHAVAERRDRGAPPRPLSFPSNALESPVTGLPGSLLP
jgi:hypothetical protein